MRRAVTGPAPPPSDGAGDGRVELVLSCGHRVWLGAAGPRPDEVDCGACARRSMPPGLVAGRRTPSFTAATVPPALLADHRTAVWARLEVEAGTVAFVDEGPGGVDVVADPGHPVTIVPDRPHRVRPSPGARFAVQFFDPGPAPAG